jgi:plastocyanin
MDRAGVSLTRPPSVPVEAANGCSTRESGITGNMRNLTKVTIGLLAILGLAFTAVSVDSDAPAGAQAGGKAISIKDFQYNPADLQVKAGETVTVTNSDTAPHTVTAKDGSFNADVPANGSATLTVSKAGSHPYDCTYHPGQHNPASITAS